jgi:hypothetical protein
MEMAKDGKGFIFGNAPSIQLPVPSTLEAIKAWLGIEPEH